MVAARPAAPGRDRPTSPAPSAVAPPALGADQQSSGSPSPSRQIRPCVRLACCSRVATPLIALHIVVIKGRAVAANEAGEDVRWTRRPGASGFAQADFLAGTARCRQLARRDNAHIGTRLGIRHSSRAGSLVRSSGCSWAPADAAACLRPSGKSGIGIRPRNQIRARPRAFLQRQLTLVIAPRLLACRAPAPTTTITVRP